MLVRAAGVALAVACLAALPAVAEPWSLAPIYGADVRSLVFDPREPERAFCGTSAGHVYRSEDGGETWQEAGAGVPFPGWVVGTLVFDLHRPERLWAGLWGIWGGGAVAYTDDAGGQWTLRARGLPPGDQVYALTPVPSRPGRLLAATRTGVWATEDDGESWYLASSGTPELRHVSSLLVDPLDARRILAGTWRRAFRSEDGGSTWRGVFDGMTLDTEVFALAAVPGRAGDLWASTCGWVYRGEDFGRRWERVTAGFAERRTPSLLVISPERLLAGTVAGLHVSSDGGRTFRRTSDPRLPVLALAHHPARPERVLVGTEGAGVWLSEDGGESLAPRLAATANVRVPAMVAAGPALLAAVAHAGPLSGLYRSADGGASFEYDQVELPTVLDLATDGSSSYAATERGLYERVGGEWRKVAEVGDERVEQLVAAGGRLLARTPTALWERVAERFRRLEVDVSPPWSGLALAWSEIWLRTAAGLERLSPGASGALEATSTSLPAPDGTLVDAGSRHLVVATADGLYRRADPGGAWQRLGRGRARALATGDGRFALLIASEDGIALLDDERGELLPLPAGFPADAALSAAVIGDRLLVGTSGYGLWTGEVPGAHAPEVEAAQPAPSDAKIRK